MTKLFTAEDFNAWRHCPPEANMTGIMAAIANARLAPLVEALEALRHVASQCRNQGDAVSVAQQCIPLLAVYEALRKERP